MVPEVRSNSAFRNNHALTKMIFCQEKYPHLLLSSREHRFHLRQCVKYSRILWEGVKLEELKIGTPYAKHNLREGWPDKKSHSIYSFKNFQLKNSQWTNKRKKYKLNFFKVAQGIRLASNRQQFLETYFLIIHLIFSYWHYTFKDFDPLDSKTPEV